MLASSSKPEGGKWLRAERERLCLSTRDVERLSHGIAQQKNNQYYYISHAWLADIENGKFTPGIFKLYSLSVIYGRSYDEIVAFFGIPISDIEKEHRTLVLPRTYLVGVAPEGGGKTFSALLELREKVQLQRTNLVSKMFENWREAPLPLLQQKDWQNSLYGYIGMEDYRLYPLIRPGSFVQIDSRQRRIKTGDWQSEFDRPIYFVELRDCYVCSWCQVEGSKLILVSTPQSRVHAKQVRYPGDAEVLGRVTAVTMRIAEMR